MQRIKIALIGLGFGGAFAEIYKAHPNVSEVVLFDTNKSLEATFRARLGIPAQYDSFEAILSDPSIDAVHLVTPIPLHEEQSVRVLNAGKHCACTVPMATSLDGIRRIIDAKRISGKRYMLMETTLYTYQFLYIKRMLESGQLGRIQFMRGTHYQDMAGWPDYWMGLPPMYYGTHAIAPLIALSGARAHRVMAFGSGTMDENLTARYGNPFPVESALIDFGNGIKAEATRSLFETARAYQEGLFVYGSDACFEWGFHDADQPYITTTIPAKDGSRGGRTHTQVVQMPNFADTLPDALKRFTVGGNYDPLNPQKSLKIGAGGGHHGSHPHLVNEFIMSIIDDRPPSIDETLGANITATGICAHESAMNGGMMVEVPGF